MLINAHYKVIHSLKEFLWWFSRAQNGETVIYHVGDLSYDRQGQSVGAKHIDEIGAQAWEYARTEELHLVQFRRAVSLFEYRAIKTSPRNVGKLEALLRKPLGPNAIERTIRVSQ